MPPASLVVLPFTIFSIHLPSLSEAPLQASHDDVQPASPVQNC